MKPASLLAKLQRIDWSKAEASLWALYFESKGEDAPVKLRLIKTKPRLQHRLSIILCGDAKRAKSVKPYDWQTSDLDEDEALVVESGRDLLKEIVKAIDFARTKTATGESAPVASLVEVRSAAGYVIRLEAPNGEMLHGYRKMPESVTTTNKFLEVVFDQFVLDEEQKMERFRLSKTVDAFHFEDTSFVLSKMNFEAGLRYREAMRTSAKAAVEEIGKVGILANPDFLLRDGEESLGLLRKLASIGKDARFKDPNWLARVRALNDKHGWGLQFNDKGALLLDDKSMELILVLLRDRRAITLIFTEMIDAAVARVVVAVGE